MEITPLFAVALDAWDQLREKHMHSTSYTANATLSMLTRGLILSLQVCGDYSWGQFDYNPKHLGTPMREF